MDLIDFRSDTVTTPTKEMLDAMISARVGDDVYGDDPTVNMLEDKSAAILGKESAVFVPSGTFGNQLAILTHANRGDEVIISEDNHIVLYEVGAPAVISSVQLRFLKAGRGKVDVNELKTLYRDDDIHFPKTGLICMENAHTDGTVVAVENMRQVCNFAKSVEVPTHLDGARIFNAAISLGVDPKDIAKYFDSVMFCFSKGLCAPVGSVLTGSRSFIQRAKKNRKLMGGGMRQAGYLAAPCIVALEKMVSRLKEDHKNAKFLAEKLNDTGFFNICRDRLDINMVFFKIKNEVIDKNNYSESEFIKFMNNNNIKISPGYNGEFRFVTHYYIDEQKIKYSVDLIEQFFKRVVK